MRRREDPARLADLVAVQRVRRVAAEAALHASRDDERTAIGVRDTAGEDLSAAEAFWIDHVSAATFAPERAQALATFVIASGARMDHAAERLDECRETLARSSQAWRMAEAQVRSIERDHTIAIRGAGHRREEKRLAQRDDRTMRKWGAT